jgi:hypothetical protein
MTKAVKDLIDAAEAAVVWWYGDDISDDPGCVIVQLHNAVQKLKARGETDIRTGYLVLVELSDGRKRITATVESGDKYLSRSGIASLGVDAEVVYSAEVEDLDQAREGLRIILKQEQWAGHGMTWCESPREELIAAIQTVAEGVNNHKENNNQ